MGITGFRINFAKLMSPDDLTDILKKVQDKVGGSFPADFLVWLEITTGSEKEAHLLWNNNDNVVSYGAYFNKILTSALNTTDVQKIKIWDGLYPEKPDPQLNSATPRSRIVIQNDDQNQQFPDKMFGNRIEKDETCILVSKKCNQSFHRNQQIKLFKDPIGGYKNASDWPIRVILSSYNLQENSKHGIPDGFSDCEYCKSTRVDCVKKCLSVDYIKAAIADECAYPGKKNRMFKRV